MNYSSGTKGARLDDYYNEFIGYMKFSTLINIHLKHGFYINISTTLNITYMDVQLYQKHQQKQVHHTGNNAPQSLVQ